MNVWPLKMLRGADSSPSPEPEKPAKIPRVSKKEPDKDPWPDVEEFTKASVSTWLAEGRPLATLSRSRPSLLGEKRRRNVYKFLLNSLGEKRRRNVSKFLSNVKRSLDRKRKAEAEARPKREAETRLKREAEARMEALRTLLQAKVTKRPRKKQQFFARKKNTARLPG